MDRQTVEMLLQLQKLGISIDDTQALRRIAMTLHRWFELECGNSDDRGSWAIERQPVTARELKKVSSPACSPQYTMTIPAGTRVDYVDGKPVVGDTKKVEGSSALVAHDLAHHYIWLDADDVDSDGPPYMVRHHYRRGTGPDPVTRTRIPDREAGARKRLAAIMARYPTLRAYVQTDPRGASLYILPPDREYPSGVAVFK